MHIHVRITVKKRGLVALSLMVNCLSPLIQKSCGIKRRSLVDKLVITDKLSMYQGAS